MYSLPTELPSRCRQKNLFPPIWPRSPAPYRGRRGTVCSEQRWLLFTHGTREEWGMGTGPEQHKESSEEAERAVFLHVPPLKSGPAWGLAQSNIKKAQKKQKEQHDKRAWDVPLKIGQRVFLHVPSLKSGPAHKLARPYWITALHPNGAELQSVDHPNPSNP